MTTSEEKLEVLGEGVVAAEIGEERTIGCGTGITFIAVTEELETKHKLVCELVLEECASEGEVAIAVLRDDGFTTTGVDGPFVVGEAFLEPERDAVPGGADTKTFGGVPGGELDEGKDTGFGKELCFVGELDLGAEFGVAEAVSDGAVGREVC